MKKISNKKILKIHNLVASDKDYGAEDKLIHEYFNKHRRNSDVYVVASKIALIDVTNNTHIGQHKKKVNLYDLAKKIVSIKDFDKRVKDGDPNLVKEIADLENINLFSFASKYCCNHNYHIYGKDDYSIYDGILRDHLPDYFSGATKYKIDSWRDTLDYKAYNDYIGSNLKKQNITLKYKRRAFDHYVWWKNRKNTKTK